MSPEEALTKARLEVVADVLEILEIHLDMTGDDRNQKRIWVQLRTLRGNIIEDILEVPEEQYDNDREELENPEGP